ncbi:MAG TPA: hypothetical protein VNK43_03135 [Gemmatimonadales bacterium]|nr:hypothetical protein [Gemmatimonadales bacterium]
MRLRTFLTIAGALAIGFGLAFLLAPAATLAPYGIATADPGVIVMSRFFGAALVQLGLLALLARTVVDRDALRAILMAGTAGTLTGLAVALWAQLARLIGPLGWSTVAIYALLSLGYGYFLQAVPRAAAASPRTA